jgi:2'-5' RNA ligase
MDDVTFEHFDAQRQKFFPPERNFIPAHVTLFHHLPSNRLEDITATLEGIAARTLPMTAEVTGLRFLGRGVAYDLNAPRLERLRSELAQAWHGELTNQDRSGFKPHVTVQNKVSSDTARETLTLLEARFTPWTFQVLGLDLWRYLGGPWALLESWRFSG